MIRYVPFFACPTSRPRALSARLFNSNLHRVLALRRAPLRRDRLAGDPAAVRLLAPSAPLACLSLEPRRRSCPNRGPVAGIRALSEVGQEDSLRHNHLFDATLGEFHRRAGNLQKAREHLEAACAKTDSVFARELIDWRLGKCT